MTEQELPSGYKPLTDLEKSQQKLNQESLRIENTSQTLYECILDVMSSRGDLNNNEGTFEYQSLLRNEKGWVVELGHTYADFDRKHISDMVYMTIAAEGKDIRGYSVERCSDEYKLVEIDSEERLMGPYINSGLAAARLLFIIAEAHQFSPLEESADS